MCRVGFREKGILLLLLSLFVVSCIHRIGKKELIRTIPDKKPYWIDGKVPPNYYVGIATQKLTLEGAREDAEKDAIKKILEEAGVTVEDEYEKRREESGDEFNLVVKSRTRVKAKGNIRDVKGVESYVEEWRVSNGGVRYFYNAWVLIKVPEGEVERVREEIKEFENELIMETKRLIDKARNVESTSPLRAINLYREALVLLNDVRTASAEVLKKEIEAQIKYLEKNEDPYVRMERLEGNEEIIKNAFLVMVNGEPSGKWLEPGTYHRVKIKVERPCYVYLFNSDVERREMTILFPNEYDRDNYIVGEKEYPSMEGVYFEAREPAGFNVIYVIATVKKYEFSGFTVNTPQLSEFLIKLREDKFDVKRIEYYIKR